MPLSLTDTKISDYDLICIWIMREAFWKFSQMWFVWLISFGYFSLVISIFLWNFPIFEKNIQFQKVKGQLTSHFPSPKRKIILKWNLKDKVSWHFNLLFFPLNTSLIPLFHQNTFIVNVFVSTLRNKALSLSQTFTHLRFC